MRFKIIIALVLGVACVYKYVTFLDVKNQENLSFIQQEINQVSENYTIQDNKKDEVTTQQQKSHKEVHDVKDIVKDNLLPGTKLSNQKEESKSGGSHTQTIKDNGVTWNFSQSHRYGAYVTGGYWIVGPVEITSTSPESMRGFHGSESNPDDAKIQPYDKRAHSYDTTHLIEYPYTAEPGESIVKAISLDIDKEKCRPCLQKVSILTIVNSPPAINAFRPSYSGNIKKLYTTDDIHWDLLPSYDKTELTIPSYSGIQAPNFTQTNSQIIPLSDTAKNFSKPWLDHMSDWIGRSIHPKDHMPDYGGDMASMIGTSVLRTMLSDPQEQKQETVLSLLQYGIDIEGMMQGAQTRFPGNGGHSNGRKLVLAYAAILLGDDDMKRLVGDTGPNIFSENDHVVQGNQQLLLGDKTNPNEALYWKLLQTQKGNKTQKDPYGYIDGGFEAGNHYLIPINAALWKANVVAMELMPEIKDIWNDQNHASLVQRYVEHGKWTQPDPCAPYDGIDSNLGVTYGPDKKGGCIRDLDPSDGIGRYPNLHGTQADAGAYMRYRVPLADALWNKLF